MQGSWTRKCESEPRRQPSVQQPRQSPPKLPRPHVCRAGAVAAAAFLAALLPQRLDDSLSLLRTLPAPGPRSLSVISLAALKLSRNHLRARRCFLRTTLPQRTHQVGHKAPLRRTCTSPTLKFCVSYCGSRKNLRSFAVQILYFLINLESGHGNWLRYRSESSHLSLQSGIRVTIPATAAATFEHYSAWETQEAASGSG
jgi:hypothetical protein